MSGGTLEKNCLKSLFDEPVPPSDNRDFYLYIFYGY